jgi:S-phase kinase-associated protein 1
LKTSKEGDVYEVPLSVAKMSKLVDETLSDDDKDDDDTDDGASGGSSDEYREIPLPNVTAVVLQKVVDYCTHYQQVEAMATIQTPLRSGRLEDLVQPWYADFVKVEKELLFDLVAAANFMDIQPLLDLTCLAVSILIKGKSAVELREMFNISNEHSQVESEAIAATVRNPPSSTAN